MRTFVFSVHSSDFVIVFLFNDTFILTFFFREPLLVIKAKIQTRPNVRSRDSLNFKLFVI